MVMAGGSDSGPDGSPRLRWHRTLSIRSQRCGRGRALCGNQPPTWTILAQVGRAAARSSTPAGGAPERISCVSLVVVGLFGRATIRVVPDETHASNRCFETALRGKVVPFVSSCVVRAPGSDLRPVGATHQRQRGGWVDPPRRGPTAQPSATAAELLNQLVPQLVQNVQSFFFGVESVLDNF